MPDLFILSFDDNETVRCLDIGDAKNKASSRPNATCTVEIILDGEGGPVTNLKFDHDLQDWVSL
jgi:hypothetical protein